jgi:formylglycine-generating enzyme required for sulfatase activity
MTMRLVAVLALMLCLFPECAPADDAAPRKAALLVGVNRYLKPGFNDLQFAEADVTAVGVELEKLGFTVNKLLGSGQGSEQATRENIHAAAEKMVKPLGKNDMVFVMLSGHGQQLLANPQEVDINKSQSYYCPVDARLNDPQSQVSLSYLLDEVLARDVGRTILLVDACRDIPLDSSRGSRSTRGVEGRRINLPEGTGVYFSCSAGQMSFEKAELGHGLFTYCVLEGLKGEAASASGDISWSRLVAHVDDRMTHPDIVKLMPPQMRQVPIPSGALPQTILGRIEPRPTAERPRAPENEPPNPSPSVAAPSTLPRSMPAAPAAVTTPEAAPATGKKWVDVALVDGRVLSGELLAEDAISVTLRQSEGSLRIPKEDVDAMSFRTLPQTAPPLSQSGRRKVPTGSRAGEVQEFVDNLKLKMCWCPPGTFTMGSPGSETDALRRADPSMPDHWFTNERQVPVTLTHGFWIGQTELTRGQWQAVSKDIPWSEDPTVTLSGMDGPNYPVVDLSWDEAMEFCRQLTARERAAGRLTSDWEFTLPTEAQWEYACRATTTGPYNGDGTGKLGDLAWYERNAGSKWSNGGSALPPPPLSGQFSAPTQTRTDVEDFAHLVGLKKPNSWGLHDMHGNVEEWCLDYYNPLLPGGTDPVMSIEFPTRVTRGGEWTDRAERCRSAMRDVGDPTYKSSAQGMRLVLVPANSARPVTQSKATPERTPPPGFAVPPPAPLRPD